MNRSCCFGWVGLLILWPASMGCGDAGVDGRPQLYPASGVVTYKGQPVAGATVTFFPTMDALPSASAKTDSSGKYVLQTFEADDGVVPGTHKVSIMKWHIEAYEGSGDENEVSSKAAPPPKALLPQKYSIPTKSGLQATVEDGKPNQFDFELVD
jgi:hypothetical protein